MMVAETMLGKFRLAILIISIFIPSIILAETIIEKRAKLRISLIPFIKITVGPEDSYQGRIWKKENKLFYTQIQNLSPHIFVQDLTSGESKSFLDLKGDSKDPG